jgi:HSP20 family protein
MSQRQGAHDVQIQDGRLATAPRRIVTPPADVLEKSDRIVAVLDMPGADPSSLEITFSEGVLRVEGQARATQTPVDPKGGVTYAEFELGAYERSFRVLQRIDPEAITAEWNEGVLRVELPLEQPSRKRVPIRTT